ncbi:hypothetical protein AALP_AA8G072900 [Arabis alpina]|uniref:Transmembrane protein n=1 Tax=Arabis alpina TaxID=50452 RepID=A0A087G5K2_ARAAL|nr:hypothetical protein AALP_AA8G072900 [Arabis alpina]
MAEEDDLYSEEHMIGPMDPSLSMVILRESTERSVVFPPINHENLQVGSSSIHGVDHSYLDSQSETESPSSSSSRLSAYSSSSFSLFPSDSDGQSPLTASEFDRKSPSPPSDSDEQPPLTASEIDQGKSPLLPSDLVGESPPWKLPVHRQGDVFKDWWELLLLRVYAKLKRLVTWFSTTLRSVYPVLAIAIWWWLRVRARRKHVQGETIGRLRDTIKEKDERIVKLLHQIAQMNELLVKHHKEIVSRR